MPREFIEIAICCFLILYCCEVKVTIPKYDLNLRRLLEKYL